MPGVAKEIYVGTFNRLWLEKVVLEKRHAIVTITIRQYATTLLHYL